MFKNTCFHNPVYLYNVEKVEPVMTYDNYIYVTQRNKFVKNIGCKKIDSTCVAIEKIVKPLKPKMTNQEYRYWNTV